MRIEGKNIQLTLMAYTSLLDAIDQKLKIKTAGENPVLFGFFFMKSKTQLMELRKEVEALVEAANYNLAK